jgi:hypothetical protein
MVIRSNSGPVRFLLLAIVNDDDDDNNNNNNNNVARRSRCYATTARLADIQGPFLGNGSVNTFLQQQTEPQQWHNNRRALFSMWFVPRYSKQGTKLELSQFCTRVCE